MTHEQIAYLLKAVQWASYGALIGLCLRPVINRRYPHHRRSNRRD